MFAVIRTGGKQYKVAAEDVITVEKISGEPGDIVEFGEVLMLGGADVVLGSPTVAGALVAGEVVEQGRGPKVIAFKKRRRKNSRRKRGHRQAFSLIRITEILTEGRKPTPRPKAEPAPQPPEVTGAGAGQETDAPKAAQRPKARPARKGAARPKSPRRPARPAARKPAKPARARGATKGKKK